MIAKAKIKILDVAEWETTKTRRKMIIVSIIWQPERPLKVDTDSNIFVDVSDVSAHGTVWRDCIAEDLRLIFTPNGVEDDEETRDDEGPSREGCEGHPACDAQAA
jgi:hypothetical protein